MAMMSVLFIFFSGGGGVMHAEGDEGKELVWKLILMSYCVAAREQSLCPRAEGT